MRRRTFVVARFLVVVAMGMWRTTHGIFATRHIGRLWSFPFGHSSEYDYLGAQTCRFNLFLLKFTLL